MKNFILLIIIVAISAAGCTHVSPIPKIGRPNQALILIDLQRGVLSPNGPATLGEKRSDILVQASNRAIDFAMKNSIRIAFVKNEWPGWRFAENWWFGGAFRKGSEWAKIDPRLLSNIPEEKMTVFSKSIPSAFSDPNLQIWLEENKVGELIIGGLFGDKCVTSTVQDALKNGYTVKLIPDGIVTQKEEKLSFAMERLKEKGATLWQLPKSP